MPVLSNHYNTFQHIQRPVNGEDVNLDLFMEDTTIVPFRRVEGLQDYP